MTFTPSSTTPTDISSSTATDDRLAVAFIDLDATGRKDKVTLISQLAARIKTAIGNATTTVSGLLSATDKTKLNGIATGATANAADAQLRDRSTHTGTQPSTTISDFSESVDDRVAALLQPGANITFGYDDANNTITIGASGGGAGGIGLGDLSATAPLQYNSGNGQFSLNTSGFATAAQGTLAGTALQPSAIGSTIQPYDADLGTIASLAPNNNQFIRGNGTTWAVGLLAASDIPNLDAAKITTGTFTDDRFPASITRDSEVESLARAAFSFQSPIEFNGLTGAVTLNGESLGVQLASNVSITGGSVSGVAASPTTFVLPTAALAVNGQIRRNTNAVEYRDSTNATRILLNNLDNLANLGNITTARSNLKAIGSDNTGITGATTLSNAVVISQSAYDALATKDPNTAYYIPA